MDYHLSALPTGGQLCLQSRVNSLLAQSSLYHEQPEEFDIFCIIVKVAYLVHNELMNLIMTLTELKRNMGGITEIIFQGDEIVLTRNGKAFAKIVPIKKNMAKDHLTLKWGTLKASAFHSEKAKELLREYEELCSSWEDAQQHDTPRQKEIICELIDEGNFKKVYLDWDGKYVSKKEAKKYVMNY